MWLNELWQRWIRGSKLSRRQRRRQRMQTQRRPRLSLERLEDRLAPASQIYSGLEFLTAGSFSVSNNVVTSTSPVEVGVAPPKGGTFTPLLLLQSGVKFTSTDTTGTFTTSGAVSAYAGSKTLPLLDAHAHTFKAPGLLSSTSYYALPTTDTNGADLPVAGGDLAVTALHFAGQELDVQGTLSLPHFPGLKLPVGGTSHVALASSGAHLTGLNDTLIGTTFSEAGLKFTAKNVLVQYATASNQFDLSGSASLAVAGNNLSLTLGNATAPGLVIANGALQSLDATVSSNFKLDGLTFSAQHLTVQATASSNLTITGTSSVVLAVAGAKETINLTLGAKDSGGVMQSGIVINQSNGNLLSLNAVVNSDIVIDKLDLKATDLSAHYSSTTGMFSLTGGATLTLTVAGKSETIAVQLGTKDSKGDSEPGIAINLNTSQLLSLDAVVNTDIVINKLDLKATDLSAHYSSTTGTFSITGGATLTLTVAGKSETIAVQLGAKDTKGVAQPGIAINLNNSQLLSLDAVVNTDITIDSLDLKATDLSAHYNSTTGSFSITGGASLTLTVAGKTETIAVQLGAKDANGDAEPGIAINLNNGQLLSLDAVVNTDITIDSLDLKATDLSAHYSSTTGAFSISGGATLTLTVAGKMETIAVQLGAKDANGDAEPGIAINLNNSQLLSLDAVVNTDIVIDSLDLKATDLSAHYNSTTGTFSISGGATLTFTVAGKTETIAVQLGAKDSNGDAEPGIAINLNNGQLLSLDAVVNTDIVINSLDLKATDLSAHYSSSTGTFSITGGASLTLTVASKTETIVVQLGAKDANGDAEPGVAINLNNGQLLSLDAVINTDITIDSLDLKATDLSAHYSSTTGTFSITGGASLTLTVAGKTESINVQLGAKDANGDAEPGIAINLNTSQLLSLDAVVNTDISIDSLDLKATDLSAHYSSTTGTFSISGGATLTLTVAGKTETIDVQLGAKDANGDVEPGIAINLNNGQLLSLDAVVNTDITIDSLDLKATDLSAHYSSTTGTFSISGGASLTLTVAGKTESIDVQLGAKDANGDTEPGIAINLNTGQLLSLDAVVNTDITIDSLDLKATDLSAHYSSTTGTFSISGGASLTLAVAGKTETVDVTLGGTDANGDAEPGIVINLNNGQLLSLDAVVNTDITIDSLDLKATDLSAHYNSTTGTFSISGGASLTLTVAGKTETIAVQLGAKDTNGDTEPGIAIDLNSGQLLSLDAVVNTDIIIDSLDLKATDLSAHYSSTTGAFSISGGATLTLTVAGKTETIEVQLGAKDANGDAEPGIAINLNTSQLLSLDAVINADITIDSLDLKATDLSAHYSSTTGTFSISGGASLTLAVAGKTETIDVQLGAKDANGDAEPGIAINLNNGQLLSLDAVVNTDITIDSLDLKATDLSAHYSSTTGTFSISGGASLTLTVAGQTETIDVQLGAKDANGDAEPGIAIDLNSGQLLSLDAVVNTDITIDSLDLKATDLSAHYSSTTGTFSISGGASLTLTVAGKTETIAVQLGAKDANGDAEPGIAIDLNSGQLLSLDAVVNTDIMIGSLDLKATDLSAHYNSTTGTFSITGDASLSLSVAGQTETIDVQLGGTDSNGDSEPGIAVNLNTGQLLSLDAVVNSNITIDGLAVTITGLGIHYQSSASIFDIFGGASISLDVGGTMESLGITLGNQQNPGFVFDASADMLDHFDGTLTSNINIAGLTLQANNLEIQYDAATPTSPSDLVISGGASFSFDGASVSINLGGSFSPGLVIVGGALESLQAAVSGSFDLLGLKINADNLTVAYVAANGNTPAEFALFGSVAIDSSFINFDTMLGTEQDPGILIANGQLQSLNITVSGSFSLFGIDVSANGLTIQYSSAAHQLALSGGFMLDFTSSFEVGAAITQGALLIDTTTGALSIPSTGLQIEGSATLGPFAVRNLMISFSTGPNGVNFSASGEVDLPDNIAISLDKLDIVNGQLADIGLTVSAPIPIGDTGFFIDSLSGSLENLNNPSQLVVMASAEVSFGQKVHIPSLGPIFAGGDFALVDATGSITVSASELDLSGTVSLLGGLLGQGSASLDLNWASGVYMVAGNFSMFDNIINFTGDITITNQGDITLEAMASVNVPPQIPFVGGDSLGNINFALQYQPGQPLTQDYVAAWTSVNLFVTSFTIGFKIDFQGDVNVINGNDVAAIQAAAVSPPQPSQYTYYQNLNIPGQSVTNSNVVGAQITASSPIFDGAYPVSVVGGDSESGFFQDYSGNIYSSYQLSHSNVILSSLSFNVYVETDVVQGGIFAGTGQFDSQGKFIFTPSGNTTLVPTAATLYSDGRLSLKWNYLPYNSFTSSISATYDAADAYLELLQQTTSGTPFGLQVYSIDPVSNDPGDPVQTAMPAELLVTDNNLPGNIASSETQGPQTWYYLSHGAADPKTLSFSLYQNGTLLGTGYFDSGDNLHFTPNGTPSVVPTGGTVVVNPEGNGILKLNWSKPQTGTSVNVTYASTDNRVIDFNLGSKSAPNGVAGQYQIELVSTSPLADNQIPAFSETDQFETPTVSFVPGSVSLSNSGALTGTLNATAFTYAAQMPGDKTTTVSLYYNTGSYNSAGVPAGGQLLATYNYSDFTTSTTSNVRSYQFNLPGFANLPAGTYSVYAVINDGQNPPQYSTLVGPFTEASPTPVLSGPSFLALSPKGGSEQGVFSAANQTALGITTNFPADPVTVDLKVTGGTLTPAGGTPTTEFTNSYSSAAAALTALDGLTFVSDNTFTGAATLAFTVTTTINGKAYTAVQSIPLLTPNTHLVVTQSVDTTTPTDPSQHTLTVTVTNPGGPDGQDGTDVQLQDYLSPGLSVLSSSASQGSYNAATGLWTIGNLPIGSTVTLNLTLKADASTQGKSLTCTAQATSALFNYPASDAQSVVAVRRSQPITITVTNLNDSGTGSLRSALAAAENGDTIQFSSKLTGGTIKLTSGELLINQDLTLIGPTTTTGAPGIAISGNNASRVFDIEGGANGVNVTLENLTIENGLANAGAANAPSAGGGLLINDAGGNLTLSNLLVTSNVAQAPVGANAQGGGVAFLGGVATFNDDAIIVNRAIGGTGSQAGNSGLGGGLFVSAGNVTLIDDTIANNQAKGGSGGQGGGVNVSGGILTISNDTLANNTATVGGNVYQVAPALVESRDSIFANPGASFTAPDFYGVLAVSDHNLIDNTSGSTGFSAAAGDQLNVNANLAPLGNYGGPLPIMPPLPGSPALGAGDNGILTPETIPGLVSLWQGQGNALDTTNTNNGTLVGGVSFAPGVAGTAFQFDGSTGYIQTAPNPTSLSISDVLSVSAWVDPAVYKNDNVIIDKTQTGDAANYRFGIHGDGRLYFWNGVQAVFSSATVPLNTFTQVGFTVNAATSTLSFYINGQLDSTQSIVFGGNLNTAPVFIGRDLPGRYFQGLLGDVAVYHAVLTSAQMSLLAQPPSTVAEAGATTIPGLVSLFSGNGNTQDSTGTNFAKASASVTYTPGVVGQAFQLNGIDGQISVADSPTLDTRAFTIGGWFNVAQAPVSGSEYYLASKYDGNYHGWILRLNSSMVPTLSILSTSSSNVNAVSSQALSPNTWYYLSATFDGTTATLYIDGTAVGSATLPGGYTPSTTPLVLGSASWTNGGYFNGAINQFSYFNRVLTPAELGSLTLSGGVGSLLSTTVGLQDVYHAQNNAQDSGPGGNNGTISGGVSYAPGVVGQAFSFNGQGSYIDLGTGADIVGTGAFAVAAWIRTTSSGTQMILNQRDANNFNGEYGLSLNGGQVNWYTYGNNQYGFNFNSNASVNDGNWHLIVAVRQADGTGQIYIDGKLDNSQAAAPVPLGSGFHVYIGEDVRNAAFAGYSPNNFVGQIDEVQIYNTALTPAQIGMLYAQPAAQVIATTDQIGDARQVGGALDIGAVSAWHDLAITGSTPAAVGTNNMISYTFTVTNKGPASVAGVTLTDVLPSTVTFQSLTAPTGWIVSTPPVGQAGTVTATDTANLAPGASATFTLVVQANVTTQGAVIANTAQVGPTTYDKNTSNNTLTLSSTVPSMPPAGVDIHGQPSNTVVGQPISPAVVVAVVDANANTIPTDSIQLVTLSIFRGPKGAKLEGTTTVRAVNGIATFTDLRLNMPGTYVLKATGDTLAPDFSNSFTVSPAAVNVVTPAPVSSPTATPTPVGTLTLFGFGLGPTGLDLFEVDSIGDVFFQPLMGGGPSFLSSTLQLPLAALQDGQLLALLAGSNGPDFVVDVFNPFLPFVESAVLAALQSV